MPPKSRSNKTKPPKPPVEISEEEQWRLINESGVLKSGLLKPVDSPADEESSLAEGTLVDRNPPWTI
jgi:hypothetical protein